VEVSDDMYIVTRETAESYKKLKEKPPALATLGLSPTDVQIEPGKKQSFLIRGLDQYGQEISIGQVVWKATGGTIDSDGVFTAGQDEGNFVVAGTVGSIKGSATLTVAKAGKQPPKQAASPDFLRWSGEIPAQKWMNFYTKVLSKFANTQGLKLILTVEVSSPGGISSQKIEETKVALQELGLNPDLENR